MLRWDLRSRDGMASAHHGHGAGPYRSAGGLALHRCIFESLVFVADRTVAARWLDRFGGLQPALEAAGPVTLAVIATVVISAIAVGVPRRLHTAMAVASAAPARSGAAASSILSLDGRHARRGEHGRSAVIAA